LLAASLGYATIAGGRFAGGHLAGDQLPAVVFPAGHIAGGRFAGGSNCRRPIAGGGLPAADCRNPNCRRRIAGGHIAGIQIAGGRYAGGLPLQHQHLTTTAISCDSATNDSDTVYFMFHGVLQV
jgi:hypothetical protein